jgi:hypothetical protein
MDTPINWVMLGCLILLVTYLTTGSAQGERRGEQSTKTEEGEGRREKGEERREKGEERRSAYNINWASLTISSRRSFEGTMIVFIATSEYLHSPL